MNLSDLPALGALDARRGHPFFPPAAELRAVPRLYSTERTPLADKVIHLHYFAGSCDWWLAEIDREELIAFGFACLGDPANAEWGNVSLAELALLYVAPEMHHTPTGTFVIQPGLVVERDLHWTPRPWFAVGFEAGR